MLGNDDKKPAEGEAEMQRMMRRGTYAARDLVAGDVIGIGDLLFVRPETPPRLNALHRILGHRLTRAIAAHAAIQPADPGE